MCRPYKKQPMASRFWPKVQKGDGCWEWTATLSNKGYGNFRIHRRTHYAHRVAWELSRGPIPEGLCVLHHCDNPKCVRPDHLFLGMHLDNVRDMIAKGRSKGGIRGREKTHCQQGHPFSEQNTWIDRRGWRFCRTCQAARARKRNLARKIRRVA